MCLSRGLNLRNPITFKFHESYFRILKFSLMQKWVVDNEHLKRSLSILRMLKTRSPEGHGRWNQLDLRKETCRFLINSWFESTNTGLSLFACSCTRVNDLTRTHYERKSSTCSQTLQVLLLCIANNLALFYYCNTST